MVPWEETNLLVPVIPPTTPLAPAPLAKFDTLCNEVNCLLPNVGAGRGILLSRTKPVAALFTTFSAEVAYNLITYYYSAMIIILDVDDKQVEDLSRGIAVI